MSAANSVVVPPDLNPTHAECIGDVLVLHPLRGQQHNARSLAQPDARCLGSRQPRQLALLLIRQLNRLGYSQLLAPIQTEGEHWRQTSNLSLLKSQTLHQVSAGVLIGEPGGRAPATVAPDTLDERQFVGGPMEPWLGHALSAFMGFFAIMNPLANTPIFLGLTSTDSAAMQKRVARKSVLTAFALIAVFALAGKAIFTLFGITLPAFRIMGGILVALIGYQMLHGEQSKVQHPAQSDGGETPP
ncbi:MAG: MarC family protein, partial [Rubrivivax sp.]